MQEFIEIMFRTERTKYFVNSNKLDILPDMNVIVKVGRGEDIGRVISCSISNEKLEQEFADGKIDTILRVATKEDFIQLEAVEKKEKEAKKKFVVMKERYPFEMKLIDGIYQLDGNKLTFFFSSDNRIDFRDFVYELASYFKTRIELHQTSGREDARRLCGLGMCGRTYCCVTFLKKFSKVTIQMAKEQNLLTNLSKISGPCGRLLCCLHYEEKFYQERAKDFPELGFRVKYDDKVMFVDKNDYYNDKVTLVSEDNIRTIISLQKFNKIKK